MKLSKVQQEDWKKCEEADFDGDCSDCECSVCLMQVPLEHTDLVYLLRKQKQLDDYIIKSKELEELDPTVRLTNTTLALMVEASEFANETRSFKRWSKKGMSDKEVVIEEFADILFFYLSLANQLEFTAEDIEAAYMKKFEKNIQRQKEGY
jgi:dimeric dUTPase (all-alpha-NTP-PPase superfamily)